MKKSFILVLAATVLIFIAGILLVSKGGGNNTNGSYPTPTNLTYYWGNGCPHCAKVEEFLKTWEKKDQVKIDKKEVWYNKVNAKELQARYQTCGIANPNEMGVPLLFTPEGKCFSGDTPIIDYFKSLK